MGRISLSESFVYLTTHNITLRLHFVKCFVIPFFYLIASFYSRREIIKEVVERYLDCGNLRCGFARIRYPDCPAERLLLAAEPSREYFS
jgi:hypothetical protein